MSRDAVPGRMDAPAKLNLCLYVGPRREDGLHEIRSLFEPLELGDELRISESEEDEVICEALGSEYAQYYIKVKTDEWNAYHQSISQWEIDQYLKAH